MVSSGGRALSAETFFEEEKKFFKIILPHAKTLTCDIILK